MRIDADLRAAAARNNAIWCDAMTRAHGAAGTFGATAWINPRPTPPYYPNLVTLGAPEDSAAHLGAVRRLMAAPPRSGRAVKDSFAALDLAPLGFDLLLEASWIWRPARAFEPNPVAWRAHRVTSEDALEAWEHAWRGGTMDSPDRLFRPALLTERDHAIIAMVQDDAIIAGCIASRSDGVIGISNLFAPAGDDGARVACLAAALDFAPGSPLVGYESGGDLACMLALGFTDIGPLRVWQARR